MRELPVRDRLLELFDYDACGALTWRVSTSNRIKVGSIAGTLRYGGNGKYIVIGVDGVQLYAHRLIFLWHHGWCPEVVDHVDMNRLNNRIENLRAASKSANGMNRGAQANNTSGYKGVTYCRDRKKWVAQITAEGAHRNLGRFDTAEDAAEVYRRASEELHGEFARS